MDNLHTIVRIGISWYKEETFDELREIFSDGDRLHSTYAGWLKAAETGETELANRGHQVRRVEIDPILFPAWCVEQGLQPDATARMSYCNEAAFSNVWEERFLQAQADVRRRVRLAADTLENHVVPIFTIRKRGQIDFEGSGILGRLEGRYYLVTAAHVIDACEQGVFLPHFEGINTPLSNNAIVTRMPATGRREDDKLDIGVIRLTDDEVSQIGTGAFFDLTHTLDGPPEEPVLMMLGLGFPARDQKIRRRQSMVETVITSFLTGCAEWRGYQVARVDPRLHILLRYRRDQILYNDRYNGSSPSLKGMSGGGVWPVSLRQDHDAANPPPLAAMIIEQPRKYGLSILATRAHVIRDFILRLDADT